MEAPRARLGWVRLQEQTGDAGCVVARDAWSAHLIELTAALTGDPQRPNRDRDGAPMAPIPD